MTPHNTIPGDGAVSHSIIYGGNFFMGGNIVFGEGNSHIENDEYEHSTTLENSNDETFMDFSNEHDKAENCSKLELSQKVTLELDSQFWNREESPYSFDPEDGKLSTQESMDDDVDDGDIDDDVDDGDIDDDDDVEDDEYVVEKIVDHRFNDDGELEYFIKWDGWDEKDNTWELSKNVFAQKLVNEYWNSLSVKQSLPKSEPLNSDSPSTGLDVEIQKKVKKRKQPQEPLKSTKINSPSTDLDVEIQKKSKKRKPKSVISSSDEERSGKTNISSSQTTLSQDSGNTEPKKIKKTKYKKRIEKQPKFESNDIGPEISSDWERDIGDIESVELKDERLVVFVAWNSGVRSMHYVEEVNQKAPQRMLGFYQHHLKIKKFVRRKRWYCF